jgi:hypothetical protein
VFDAQIEQAALFLRVKIIRDSCHCFFKAEPQVRETMQVDHRVQREANGDHREILLNIIGEDVLDD